VNRDNGGDDLFYGGSGADRMIGDTGQDTFIFDGDTAFNGQDKIKNFSLSDGDAVDISDVLEGFDPLSDAIADFVQITDAGNKGSLLSVDVDGGGDNFVAVTTINTIESVKSLDLQTLIDDGNLIVF